MSLKVLSPRVVALASLVACAGSAHAQVGPFTGSAPIDLSTLSFIDGERTDYPLAVSDAGEVLGNTLITKPDGQYSLYAWRAVPGEGAVLLGLSGPAYDFPGNARFDTIAASNASGRIVGNSTRVNPASGLPLASSDAWIFDGSATRFIGLTPADVINPDGPDASLLNLPIEVTSEDIVSGISLVYRNDGVQYYAGWTTNSAGDTIDLLPPGEGYIDPETGARNVQVLDMNDAGVVIGSAFNYSLGFPILGFAYENGQYRELGLRGPAFEDAELNVKPRTQPAFINNAGVIVGATIQRFESDVSGLWMDNGAGAVPIGLSGGLWQTQQFFSQTLLGLDENGVASGVAYKLGAPIPQGLPAAQSMFVARSGETTQIGLLDAQHSTPEGYEYNAPFVRAKDGSIAGFAIRTDVSPLAGSSFTGWVYDPSRPTLGTVAPRLRGPQFTSPEGEELSYIIDANDGTAIGIQRVYVGDSDFWYAGFVANIETGTVTPLIFESASDGRTRTYPLMVTQRGGVFGYYTKFENNEPAGDRPFYWSPRAGFVDLQPANAPPLQVGVVPQIVVSPDGTRVAVSGTLLTGDPGLLRVALPQEPAVCDSIDFNNDGLFPSDDDLVSFLTVLAGGSCGASLGDCNDIDFNNDGLFPSDDDLLAYLRVLAGGNC
jgi:hypothetical protein